MNDLLLQFIKLLAGGIVGAAFATWLSFRYQKISIVRAEVKEIRNRLIFIRANMEAYEYALLAQADDYTRIACRYASKYTHDRFSHTANDQTVQELAEKLEATREKYETTMFEFRKLVSELKTLTNEHERIEQFMVPFIKEDFDKWNFRFNAMKTKDELIKYEKENKEDQFGQGGQSIEPTKSIREKKQLFVEHFTLLYTLTDQHIGRLLPKEIRKKLPASK